jgi:hypothetical protein
VRALLHGSAGTETDDWEQVPFTVRFCHEQTPSCTQVPALAEGWAERAARGLEVLRAVYCHARIRAMRARLLPPAEQGGLPAGAGGLWRSLLGALAGAAAPQRGAALAELVRVRLPGCPRCCPGRPPLRRAWLLSTHPCPFLLAGSCMRPCCMATQLTPCCAASSLAPRSAVALDSGAAWCVGIWQGGGDLPWREAVLHRQRFPCALLGVFEGSGGEGGDAGGAAAASPLVPEVQAALEVRSPTFSSCHAEHSCMAPIWEATLSLLLPAVSSHGGEQLPVHASPSRLWEGGPCCKE